MKINNRGAASILVILIIVVLATFGGIALTAGWTNKQLAIKAAQSKADYYALDSAAEEIVAETDSLLYAAMEKTKGYLNGLVLSSDISALQGEPGLAALFTPDTESIASAALKIKKINETFIRLYYFECAKSLEAFAGEKGLAVRYSDRFGDAQSFLNPENKIPEGGDLLVEFIVTEGGGPGKKSLDIEIAVKAPDIHAEIINDETWRTDFKIEGIGDNARFEIYSWKLRQNPVGYEEEKPKFG